MTLLEHLRRMARNNLWSNDRLYRAVLALKPGEFEAERTSFFPSIRETLNHVLAVDRLYMDFLTDGGLGAAAYDDYVPFDNATDLAAAQVDFDRKLVAFCDSLSEADLDRRVITDRREDGMIPEKIGDILTHVFLHDIHHRGQVHAMLSGTSTAPPQLDEFLLECDIKLRKDEVERLKL
jgi:uncharacterized damage-inducible protein DinB